MKQTVKKQPENPEVTHPGSPFEIIQLTELHTNHFVQLIAIFQQAFNSSSDVVLSPTHLRKLLSEKNFVAMVVLQSDRVIGGLTAYVLPGYYTTKPSVYLYDLAVTADWQRRGVGKCLIEGLVQFCKDKGCREVFVQAESDDLDAVAFYRNTSVSGETAATQFYYTLIKE